MKARSARASRCRTTRPKTFARADIKGGKQRAGPAPTVLELVADDAMTPHVDRVTARQRLHRLLVDAHDDSILGRLPVETADSRDLRSKVGIREMEPVANTVRAPAIRGQDASDGTAAHSLAAARVQGVRHRLVGPHVAKDHAVVSPVARTPIGRSRTESPAKR